ncbi:uncharacterized protein KQ657_001826 [Scheffersomyces spartinae]|uniref:Ribonuclease n=1 Tax=Scheffersomyces spartinae TaxID=45513 RepID=A0A9P7V6T4_9ASCO|nr:uncharacterized protein KQ657_001826 [Scheffersomyces spartinae]KAG7192425.1 hypothetical protein KQ657_001826 [Scheffersomyces spartinae]
MTQTEDKWRPVSFRSISDPERFESSVHEEFPPSVLDVNESIVLGVDEAGRGPVLGPMVYGVAFCSEEVLTNLQKDYGFADSKVLKEAVRELLFKRIEDGDLYDKIGWATTTLTARDILLGMLGKKNYNLNEQAHDTTIELIRRVLAKGVHLTKVFVDTVGPPVKYQAKLQSYFPGIEITVSKKADSIYPIVSVASVMAKVTRDGYLKYFEDQIGTTLGSGYPSDPNTTKWLNGTADDIFGWNPYGIVRYLWQPAKDRLKKSPIEVSYPLEEEDPADGITSFFNDSKPVKESLEYYGQSVAL